jgi:hypothetical protein
MHNYGNGMVQGYTLGIGERTDFTDPYKYYPPPDYYQPPLLTDKFAHLEVIKKQQRYFKR